MCSASKHTKTQHFFSLASFSSKLSSFSVAIFVHSLALTHTHTLQLVIHSIQHKRQLSARILLEKRSNIKCVDCCLFKWHDIFDSIIDDRFNQFEFSSIVRMFHSSYSSARIEEHSKYVLTFWHIESHQANCHRRLSPWVITKKLMSFPQSVRFVFSALIFLLPQKNM